MFVEKLVCASLHGDDELVRGNLSKFLRCGYHARLPLSGSKKQRQYSSVDSSLSLDFVCHQVGEAPHIHNQGERYSLLQERRGERALCTADE